MFFSTILNSRGILYIIARYYRTATYPDWHSLSTSTHCLVNVMRRHGLLSHAVSVKHYEAIIFSMFIVFLSL